MKPPPSPEPARDGLSPKRALGFVVLLGVVSLLADITYEGARSIAGPYLAALGASGAIVGFVAGFGELVGYGLRLLSGLISDRTRRYWTMTIAGYVVNLLAVPLLALAGRWEVAAGLMVAERLGKAIRNPPRDAMLSHAAAGLGAGWAFGLHEALDQIGAVAGPLIVATVLQFRQSYRAGFAFLAIPAVLALAVLIVARTQYPRPQDLEPSTASPTLQGFSSQYWVYLGAVGLVAAGFVDFPLIAFHFQRTGSVPQSWVPILYAAAMGADATSALIFGRLFDRAGVAVLAVASLACCLFAPLVFFGGFPLALLGMTLWGVGMGAQESVMRAAVARMVPPGRRASSYGVFNAWYGLSWFAGSALLGALYDFSIPWLVVCSVLPQVVAAPLFLRAWKRSRA